jgi:predicted DNA-binding transcriptional regulator AlpA
LEAALVPDALLTFETVAALCGMCIRSIERRQRAGELGDLVRLAPNVVRLRSRDVVAWLAAQKPAPMPASHRPPGRLGEPRPSTTPAASPQKATR